MNNSISMPIQTSKDLPQITLRELDVAEIRYWEVNQEYYMVMKVKMTGKHTQYESKSPQDAKFLEGDFKITSIKALGDEPVDSKRLERQDFERTMAGALSVG